MRAPARMYSVSRNIAPSPAPASTQTTCPTPVNRRTTGGVSATRRSNAPRSRMTPISISGHRRIHVEKLGADGVQPLRHDAQNRPHEPEPERIVFLAGMAQSRSVERQRMHLFESPRLKLLAIVARHRRPPEHFARVQSGYADRPSRRYDLQCNIAFVQEVEKAGMITLVEDQLSGEKSHFAGHGCQPCDMVGPKALGKWMVRQKARDTVRIHRHLMGVVLRNISTSIYSDLFIWNATPGLLCEA